ncbi:MAG: hypothetical protein SGPRY_006414 [Prymnesium sp.]
MGVAETPTCVVIAYARAADPCFGASLGATTARSERGAAAGRRSASLSSAGMTRETGLVMPSAPERPVALCGSDNNSHGAPPSLEGRCSGQRPGGRRCHALLRDVEDIDPHLHQHRAQPEALAHLVIDVSTPHRCRPFTPTDGSSALAALAASTALCSRVFKAGAQDDDVALILKEAQRFLHHWLQAARTARYLLPPQSHSPLCTFSTVVASMLGWAHK